MNSEATLLAVKPRLRNNRSGSTGSAARRSHATKAARNTTPATKSSTIVVLPQPQSAALTRPRTTANNPAVASPVPTTSSRDDGPVLSFSNREATGSNTMPIGTLSQKIHDHEAPSTIAPPTTGPTAIARPAIAPHAPRASPRFDTGTATLSKVRVSGVMIAPPTPCSARAATSSFAVDDNAARADAVVKMASPIMNIFLRPKRSPKVAPGNRSTAKVSVYALTVHSRLDNDACRCDLIAGSAIVTTRLSSEPMNKATEVTMNVAIGFPRPVISFLRYTSSERSLTWVGK